MNKIKITPELGKVVKKRLAEGKEYREIAQEIGVGVSTVADFIEREVIRQYILATSQNGRA